MEEILEKNSHFEVKEFYDTKYTDKSEFARDDCPLIFLRCFNNWIKSCLIDQACFKLKCSQLSVLDLGCGKGGDLQKFLKNGCVVYVGVDISKPLLLNALERAEKFKGQMKCIFLERNLNEQDIFKSHLPKELEFDIVSCQFSMHYHFESKEKVEIFLKNVSGKLREGGYFISTVISSTRLLKNIKNSGSNLLSNDIFKIQANKDVLEKNSPYGKKYGFYLKGLIGEERKKEGGDPEIFFVDEYLVDIDNFCTLALKYDLHIKEHLGFKEFYEKCMDSKFYSSLYKRMVRAKRNRDQWEVCGLYDILRFRKGDKIQNRYTSFWDTYDGDLLSDKDIKIID